MAGLLERIRRAAAPPLHAMSVAQARAAYEAGAEVLDLHGGDFTVGSLETHDSLCRRERFCVGGESAGGTLAALCAILARDAKLPLRAQLLVTPGTAATADTASRRRFANGFLLDDATIEWFFDHDIDRAARHDRRFAPLEADDLEGVAPAAVLLAECDPLVDEGPAYADRLRAAGVRIELELMRGVTHEFVEMGRALPEAHAAQDFLAQFLRHTFAP